MKKLLILLLSLSTLLACNNSDKSPGQSEMKFAASLPSGQDYDIKANGDTIFYKKVTRTFSYDSSWFELHPKKQDTIINPPTNTLPTANAGPDKTITLPTNKVFLVGDGGDEDGNFTVLWTKVSGSGTLVNATTLVNAAVENLTAGTTVIRLTVTGDKGEKVSDDMTITVLPEPTQGTTTNFTTTVIPFAEADLNAPGRGAEQWHDRQDINVGYSSLDRYQRFVATRIATATRGVYNWTFFDNLVKECIANKQKLSFGYMTVYADGNTSHGLVKFSDGALAAYPEWLNNLMLANSNASLRPWKYGNVWIPNYNSVEYSNWILEFNKAIDAHIKSTTINGVPVKNVVNVIDIRGVGNWGEWHHYPYVGDYPNKLPAGRMPTFESLKRIIDAHLLGFPDNPLVAMISAHDREFFVNTWTPPAISDYLATAKNNWGGVGYRNDHWGGLDAYTWKYLDHPALANVWKTGYITGEPPGSVGGTDNMGDLLRQITKYHVAMIGNGNMGNGIGSNVTVSNNFRAASKASGYRLVITGGSITTGTNGKISVNWQNTGIAPTYENWNTVFELKNGNTIVWSGVSKFKARLFLPGSATIEDSFSNIPTGNYTLTVKLVDPTGYRAPLPLAIRNRQADGSYLLK